jgi:hypothetical protein
VGIVSVVGFLATAAGVLLVLTSIIGVVVVGISRAVRGVARPDTHPFDYRVFPSDDDPSESPNRD